MKIIPPLIAALTLTATSQELPRIGELPRLDLTRVVRERPALKPLEESDPQSAAVKDWQAGIDKLHREQGLTASFEVPRIIETDVLRGLFPDYRFIITEYAQVPLPGTQWGGLGLAYALKTTLVYDAKGKLVKKVSNYGEAESFGEMLRDAKVSLRSPEDAKRIWKALCDIRQEPEGDHQRPAEKIDEKTWHLGNLTTDITHFFYVVKLDEQGVVTGAEWQADWIAKEE